MLSLSIFKGIYIINGVVILAVSHAMALQKCHSSSAICDNILTFHNCGLSYQEISKKVILTLFSLRNKEV